MDAAYQHKEASHAPRTEPGAAGIARADAADDDILTTLAVEAYRRHLLGECEGWCAWCMEGDRGEAVVFGDDDLGEPVG